MIEFMNIAKALSDENRVRIVMALDSREELCACQLIELLGLAPSTVSKHLFLLRNAGLISGRKQGRWMHYRLNRQDGGKMVRNALDWVVESVSNNPMIKRDGEKMDALLSGTADGKCR